MCLAEHLLARLRAVHVYTTAVFQFSLMLKTDKTLDSVLTGIHLLERYVFIEPLNRVNRQQSKKGKFCLEPSENQLLLAVKWF